MLLEEEGITPNDFGSSGIHETAPDEGEQNDNPYTNEEEKELYTFLSQNNLIILYDKLKFLGLYIDHLQNINLERQEFDDLCGNTCLKLTDKPHLKIRLKTAIQSLQNERAPIAAPNISQNNSNNNNNINNNNNNNYNENIAVPPPVMSNIAGYHNNNNNKDQHYYPPPSGQLSPKSESDHVIEPGIDDMNDLDVDDIKLNDNINDDNNIKQINDNDNNNNNNNDMNNNNNIKGPGEHFYPSPYPQRNMDDNNNDDILNYIDDIEQNDKSPIFVTEVINSAYRIMIFLRAILWIMDEWIIQPAIKTKSIVIGGSFGSFLIFIMSISGMYNICKNPISKKSGSLSVLLAASELFYFVSRDALSNICYQDLYPDAQKTRNMQLYNFGIHAMLSVVLSCCLGRIIWQYRSEIFYQIHSSKTNIICNYLIYGWVIRWELNSLNGIVFGDNNNNNDICMISPKVEKIHNLLNVFFCTENAFLLGVILLAPPIKTKNT